MLENGIDLDKEIQHFISFHIKSVAELEALLVLYRFKPQAWTTDQLSQELRSNSTYAHNLLQQLVRTGLAVQTSGSQYALNPDLEVELKMIEELDRRYQTRRLSLIAMIYESPTDKIKTFADAFKIRK